MRMWDLLLLFVFDEPSGHARFARQVVHYESHEQCLAAQNWWIDHEGSGPKAWGPGWRLLIGPDCSRTA